MKSSVFFTLALAVLSGKSVVHAAPADSSAPTATIDSGVVHGLQTSFPGSPNLVNKYYNIPYAAQPRRFDIPYRPKAWSTPYNATTPGPACIQQISYPIVEQNFINEAFNTPTPQESEDCLNVNVFAPASKPQNGNLRPILFWIYGGSLEFGWNSNPAYDGTSFAANQDVILIAANYRTNVFGFPGTTVIPPTQRNLGFWDQRLALDWVQRNARSFGGDPGKVTIVGESAGSGSVDRLVADFPPPLNPPFRGAIMESGQAGYLGRQSTLTSAASWDLLIQNLNCPANQDNLTCARNAPATQIKNITETLMLSFKPVPDNFTSLEYPIRARKAGNIAHVPVMIGTNMNEGSIFTLTSPNITSFVEGILPDNQTLQSAVLSQYPISPELPTDAARKSAIYTDIIFHCPAASVADNSVAAGIPTWRYLYNATFPNVQVIPGFYAGVYHSSEIALVFGTYDIYSLRANVTAPSANEKALSKIMQTAWADFARDPMSGPGPQLSWSQVPHVQILGGQPDGRISDGGPANGTFYRASSTDALDQKCELYQNFFAKGESTSIF